MSAPTHAGRLFVASCISLVTTSMVFATRGAITGPMTEQFHLSNEQIGLIYGPSFWGFTVAIFICGLLVDLVGMRRVHALSSIGYLAGLVEGVINPLVATLDKDQKSRMLNVLHAWWP